MVLRRAAAVWCESGKEEYAGGVPCPPASRLTLYVRHGKIKKCRKIVIILDIVCTLCYNVHTEQGKGIIGHEFFGFNQSYPGHRPCGAYGL